MVCEGTARHTQQRAIRPDFNVFAAASLKRPAVPTDTPARSRYTAALSCKFSLERLDLGSDQPKKSPNSPEDTIPDSATVVKGLQAMSVALAKMRDRLKAVE